MRKLELICDYCGQTAKGDEIHWDLPQGWVVLGYHSQTFAGFDAWRVTNHFCSTECMKKAVQVKKEENGSNS